LAEKQEKEQQEQTAPAKRRRTGGRPKGSPQSGGVVSWEEKVFASEESLEEFKQVASTGVTYDLIASAMGVSRSAFYAALDRRPILREIIAEAKAKRVGKVLNRMYDDAENGNTTAQIFIAKSQAGFRDRVEHVHSGSIKHEVELEAVKRIDQMTPEQRVARLEELRALDAMDGEVIEVEVDT